MYKKKLRYIPDILDLQVHLIIVKIKFKSIFKGNFTI